MRALSASALLAIGMLQLAACDQRSPSSREAERTQPDSRVIYELRARCGKEAADWFKREHENDGLASGSIVTVTNEYTNHYNERLNRCFATLVRADVIVKSREQSSRLESVMLIDVNENREIGRYFSNSKNPQYLKCSVDDRLCATFEEWQALAKPYMDQ